MRARWILVISAFGLLMLLAKITSTYFDDSPAIVVKPSLSPEKPMQSDNIERSQAPLVVREDIIEAPSRPESEQERVAKISALERELDESNALEQLNGDSLSPEQRKKFGELLKQLDKLRIEALESELADIEEAAALLEKNHKARLEAYKIE